MKVYIEPRDWWVGYFRGDDFHYVCPLPCVVIRWARGHWRTWDQGERDRCRCARRRSHHVSRTLIAFATSANAHSETEPK